MKKTIYIWTILIIGTTVISCKKENSEDETNYSYLNESIEPYKFKSGSYWVFQNDSTKILDSIVVISTESNFYWSPPPVQGQAGTKREYYNMNLQSFLTSNNFNHFLTSNYIKQNGGGDYGQDGQPIFMSESNIGTKFNGMEIIEKFPTLIINGNSFNYIVETKITESEQYQPVFSNDTYLYFSDSIGIVKKVTGFGNGNFDSWSILRWNVQN